MELYQLRSFVTVAELGQLTRAAERLHVSQPALSAQIKSLEDELGTVLFERGAGGMALTPAGRHLLPQAERVLRSLRLVDGVEERGTHRIAWDGSDGNGNFVSAGFYFYKLDAGEIEALGRLRILPATQ